MTAAPPSGIAPERTPENAAVWNAAAAGRLVTDRCSVCGRYSFPPRRWCPTCQRPDTINPDAELPGPAVLYSFTVNHVPWTPGMDTPNVIGLAEFPNAPGVRIPCRIRTSALDALRLGMPLAVGFEAGPGGVSVPSFTPARDIDEAEVAT